MYGFSRYNTFAVVLYLELCSVHVNKLTVCKVFSLKQGGETKPSLALCGSGTQRFCVMNLYSFKQKNKKVS